MSKETFRSAVLFASREKIQLSYREIASRRSLTRRSAISHVKQDIENGYIERERTKYQCRKYRRLLEGRNIYRLTKKGKKALGNVPFYRKKEEKRQKEKELLQAILDWMQASGKKRKSIFQRVLFSSPPWWGWNPKVLWKTLVLLLSKLKKGYRLRSPLRWISSCLKDLGVGFRRKTARRYSRICCCLAFEKQTSSASPVFSSPYIAEGLYNLAGLAKMGLDISEKALEKLLRKGFDQLSSAAKVLLQVQKKRKIENLNNFLNWLLTLKNPFGLFDKSARTKESALEFQSQKAIAWIMESIGKVQPVDAIFCKKPVFRLEKRAQPKDSPENREAGFFYFDKGKTVELWGFNQKWEKVSIDATKKDALDLFAKTA